MDIGLNRSEIEQMLNNSQSGTFQSIEKMILPIFSTSSQNDNDIDIDPDDFENELKMYLLVLLLGLRKD